MFRVVQCCVESNRGHSSLRTNTPAVDPGLIPLLFTEKWIYGTHCWFFVFYLRWSLKPVSMSFINLFCLPSYLSLTFLSGEAFEEGCVGFTWRERGQTVCRCHTYEDKWACLHQHGTVQWITSWHRNQGMKADLFLFFFCPLFVF